MNERLGEIDGPVELMTAVLRSAVADLRSGPTNKHYASAVAFLEDAGLLRLVEARLGLRGQQAAGSATGGNTRGRLVTGASAAMGGRIE